MIKRNILFGLASQAVLLGLALVSTRLVFRELGAEVLGLIQMAVVMSMLLLSVSDVGMSIVLTREVAAHRRSDMGYVRDLTSSTLLIAWLACGLGWLLVLGLAPFVATDWLTLKNIDEETGILALQVIGGAMLLAIPRSVLGALLAGFERVDLWNVSNILAVGLQQGGLVAVVGMGGGIIHVAAWYGLSAAAALIVSAVMARRATGVGVFRVAWRPGVIRRNMDFSGSLLLYGLAGYVVMQADRWALSRLHPVTLLGFYGFAQSLVARGGIVPGAIASAAFPALSTSVAEDVSGTWKSQYRKLQDLTGYLSVPAFAAVAMLGTIVIGVVFDSEIARMTWFPLLLLSVGHLLISAASVSQSLAMAMRKPGIALRTNLWAIPVVAVPTVGLVAWLGMTGGGIAVVLFGLWQMIHFVPRFHAECLEESPRGWYLRTALIVGIGAMSYGLSWSGAWLAGEGLSAAGLAVSYGVGTAVFALAGWFVMGPQLRIDAQTLLREVRRGGLEKSPRRSELMRQSSQE